MLDTMLVPLLNVCDFAPTLMFLRGICIPCGLKPATLNLNWNTIKFPANQIASFL